MEQKCMARPITVIIYFLVPNSALVTFIMLQLNTMPKPTDKYSVWVYSSRSLQSVMAKWRHGGRNNKELEKQREYGEWQASLETLN